jgi:hypothetical protein
MGRWVGSIAGLSVLEKGGGGTFLLMGIEALFPNYLAYRLVTTITVSNTVNKVCTDGKCAKYVPTHLLHFFETTCSSVNAKIKHSTNCRLHGSKQSVGIVTLK